MKYESTILKRLIDTYGVVGNPRYISEIIKEFIVRGKERFPELFTHQADWLAHIDEFGLNTTYTVSYTGQSIYAPNTLERPVKSAILKGQTLVNLVTQKSGSFNGTRFLRIPLSYTLKTNAKYFVKFNVRESSLTNGVTCRLKNYTNGGVVGGLKSDGIITVTDEGYNYIEFYISNADDVTNGLDAVVDDIMLIEYQDDMENWDIPYFEGMQSVKLPVLTTSNEDGTKTNILTVNEEVELRGNVYINGQPKEDILDLLSGECSISVGESVLNGNENWSEWYHTGTLLRFMTDCSNMSDLTNIKLQCDKIPSYGYNQDAEGLYGNGGKLYLIIDNSGNKLLGNTVNDLKMYLSQNPITVQYPLNVASVKTVDLSILDQNGHNVKQLMSFKGGTHFNTRSSEGSPLPTVSVSVETDLEETLKMCSIEGNTL